MRKKNRVNVVRHLRCAREHFGRVGFHFHFHESKNGSFAASATRVFERRCSAKQVFVRRVPQVFDESTKLGKNGVVTASVTFSVLCHLASFVPRTHKSEQKHQHNRPPCEQMCSSYPSKIEQVQKLGTFSGNICAILLSLEWMKRVLTPNKQKG